MQIPDRQRMILEWLAAKVVNITAASLAIMTAPYGHSLRMLEKRYEEILDGKIFIEKRVIKNKRREFNNLLRKLRKEGLVVDRKEGFLITGKGKAKLKKILKLCWPKRKYKLEKEDSLKLIIFDIPEKERAKRDWLRSVLKEMNFTMIQKSVWAGKIKISADFLEDLNWLRLTDYVDILAVTKTGSLRQIK